MQNLGGTFTESNPGEYADVDQARYKKTELPPRHVEGRASGDAHIDFETALRMDSLQQRDPSDMEKG